MALTDEGFQKLLNEVESGNPLPFWQQLVDLLIELIEGALDIKINKTSLLPTAIEESLNLLKTNINSVLKTSATSFNPMNFSVEEIENLKRANRPSFEDEQAYNNMMGYSDELIDPTILNPSEMEEFLLLCKK
jgi:hypothetical protein